MRIKARSGIGEIIGILILIAVTIAIAGMVFLIFGGYFTQARDASSLSLSSSWECSSGISECLFNFNVQNTGSVPITALTVAEDGSSVYSGTGLSIGPGVSTSGSGPYAISCTVGSTYTVSAQVEYATGGNAIQTVSITCTD